MVSQPYWNRDADLHCLSYSAGIPGDHVVGSLGMLGEFGAERCDKREP